MKLYLIILVLAVVFAAGRSGGTEIVEGAPVLIKRVEPAAELLNAVGYLGDLRMGDLNGDGKVEFVLVRSTGGGMKPCELAAFDLDGRELWYVGSPGRQPSRPASLALHDIDGDGADEVIHFFVDPAQSKTVPAQSMADVSIQIRDGRTGKLLREASPPELRRASGKDSDWLHQRLIVANFRGNSRPRDFLVKLGPDLLAFTDELKVLWTYKIAWTEYGRHTSYTPAVGDMDGDGRDEVNGGFYILRPDGTPRWSGEIGEHMDSVIITAWDNGNIRAICSGYGHVLDRDGGVILKLGRELVPHGQEVRVADFLPDSEGPEMIIRHQGHRPDVIVVTNKGEIAHRFSLNSSPNETGMEAIYWNGLRKTALLYNGGVLWNGDGRRFADLPGLPQPIGQVKMGWYHAIPANVFGDEREEVVLYNPWDRYIWIYGPSSSGQFKGYKAGSRQYNARIMD